MVIQNDPLNVFINIINVCILRVMTSY